MFMTYTRQECCIFYIISSLHTIITAWLCRPVFVIDKPSSSQVGKWGVEAYGLMGFKP
jgi:hypothetical protein